LLTILIFIILVSITVIKAENTTDEQNNNVLIRIDSTEKIDFLSDFEIVSGKPEEYLDLIVEEHSLNDLNSQNIEYSVLLSDLNSNANSFSSQYHTFSETEDILTDTANNYPEITNLYSLGKSYENRDIWCLKISDNPESNEDEPGVFFMGLHHAREWPTLEICLYIIQQLTSEYNSNTEIKNIVDNRQIWIVPCVNPDGYYYSHDRGHDWRKNRHYFPEYSSYGVDLNRNYPGSSNGDILGSWGTLQGSVSTNPLSEVYCGPSPSSELETQAIRDVFINNDICASISWHTYGELVMWPWGYSTEKVTPDDLYMSEVGIEIASRIDSMEGNGKYYPCQSSELYPTTGDTTDWAYGYYHYVKGEPLFAYTIEACTSFHPSVGNLETIVTENYDGAIYLLEEAENIEDNTPRVISPEINNLDCDIDGNYEVSWSLVNPDSNPSYYKLEELAGISYFTDSAEIPSEKLDLNGFTRSTEKSYSGSYSYKSENSGESVSSINANYPIPVTDDTALSFNCWYDLNENDYVYVELSKNGRSYEIIDTFEENSDGWLSKEYSLSKYIDESVYVRFRHSIDSFGVFHKGFFVDDIYPVIDFDNVDILSDQIVSNNYQINDRSDGEYFYRVKGYNNEYAWGDFSTIEKIQVGNNQPLKPSRPNGNQNGEQGVEYTYSTSTTDPQGEDLFYKFDWGDNSNSAWIGPYESGETIEASHTWGKRGGYAIRVKAKDINDNESPWSDPLTVTMPKQKSFSEKPLLNFLKNFRIFNNFLEFFLNTF